MSEQTQEQALKPCPFCGGEAERYPDGDMEGWSVTVMHLDDCPMSTFAYKTQAAANAAWNRRPSPSQAFDPGLLESIPDDAWIDAQFAFDKAWNPKSRGHAEWCDQLTEALRVLLPHLAAAPSPPAPDIAQIRARFEAIYPCPEVLRGPGYSQWLARFDGYCAALGITP